MKQNNFDLIRLFAASQVALFHVATTLNIQADWVYLISFFPGVPIFFFISGFLIYQSYNNIEISRFRNFIINRILRLYPALYLCFFVTIALLLFSGYLTTVDIGYKQFLIWTSTQLTFFQFYNPDFLRGFGVGAINGSLWTISVELQFYILTPLIWVLFRYYKKTALTLFVFFVLLNIANSHLNPRHTIIEKLLSVSFLPWIYMFVTGAYISTNKWLQEAILKTNGSLLFTAYVITYYLSSHFNLGTGNSINFLTFVILSCLILKLAYTKPKISENILRKNDISYGIYIYHAPVINFLLYRKLQESYTGLFVAILLTVSIAFISWTFVERPALKLKRIALRRYA